MRCKVIVDVLVVVQVLALAERLADVGQQVGQLVLVQVLGLVQRGP